MRLCTWNVNGLESLLKNAYFSEFLQVANPDIICAQESKISKRRLAHYSITLKEWDCFLSQSRGNEGYAGVGTFCRSSYSPIKAEEGLSGYLQAECFTWNASRPWYCSVKEVPNWRNTVFGVGHHFEWDEESLMRLAEVDKEGRCVITEHSNFILINVYVPLDRDQESLENKYLFLTALFKRVEKVIQDGKNVLICGDLNCALQRVDHCDPDGIYQRKSHESTFDKDPCRRLLNKLCASDGLLIDVFRYFHPERTEAYTCWNSQTGARKTNFGTRIDYILSNKEFVENCISNCDILENIYGSDHCPVFVDIHSVIFAPHENFSGHLYHLPPFCCKHFPDMALFQQSLKDVCHPLTHKRHKSENPRMLSVHPLACNRQVERRIVGASRVFCGTVDFQYETFLPKEENTIQSGKDESLRHQKGLDNIEDTQHRQSREGWKRLLRGYKNPPRCNGHHEPCALRTVKKKGPNLGRMFYVCNRPIGKTADSRCNYFLWYGDN
eukprot:jgi/Galph1/973/GphlegSOOS_G5678.1